MKNLELFQQQRQQTLYVNDQKIEAWLTRTDIPSPSESLLWRYFSNPVVGPETNELQEEMNQLDNPLIKRHI